MFIGFTLEAGTSVDSLAITYNPAINRNVLGKPPGWLLPTVVADLKTNGPLESVTRNTDGSYNVNLILTTDNAPTSSPNCLRSGTYLADVSIGTTTADKQRHITTPRMKLHFF